MKTAIILAAGRGTKMWPYSTTRQKAALPLANKPLIAWQVEKLRRAGIKNIIVVVGYRRQQVQNALADFADINFVEQKGQGTGDALLSVMDMVQDDRFLVLYGDVVLTFADIEGFIGAQKKAGAIGSVLVQPLGKERPQDWICATVKKDRLTAVLGHPRDGVNYRLAGLFAFSKKFWPFVDTKSDFMRSVQVGMMPPDEPQLEDAIQFAIEMRERLHAVTTTGIAYDLDKPWHYLEASYYWTEYVCGNIDEHIIGRGAKVSDGADINGRIIAGSNAEIGKRVIVEGNLVVGANTKIVQGAILEKNIILGANCTVRRYCQIERNTTIGPDCFVGHGAEVGGLLLHRAYAYHFGEFWGILGDNGDVGAGTVCGNLRFDDQATIHTTGGRRETPGFGANAAYLGDFVRTGVITIIMPGVKIGPYSVIGAGTIVSEDVPDNSLLYVKQEQVKKAWGPEKYGW